MRVVATETGDRSTALVTLYTDRRHDLDEATDAVRSFPQAHRHKSEAKLLGQS